MRANTSVFGHIMGSHDEIQGYYEHHIGYYSWRSRIRQQLLHFKNHKPRGKQRYLFDKVLHNEHHVMHEVFNSRDRVIFSIRCPESTIPSIVRLYTQNQPEHEFATIKGAEKYYVERLKGLIKLSKDFNKQYFYFNADAVVDNTSQLLSELTNWCCLTSPLSEEYQLFSHSGKTSFGDSSGNIMSGKVIKQNRQHNSGYSPPTAVAALYREASHLLCDGSFREFKACDKHI